MKLILAPSHTCTCTCVRIQMNQDLWWCKVFAVRMPNARKRPKGLIRTALWLTCNFYNFFNDLHTHLTFTLVMSDARFKRVKLEKFANKFPMQRVNAERRRTTENPNIKNEIKHYYYYVMFASHIIVIQTLASADAQCERKEK